MVVQAGLELLNPEHLRQIRIQHVNAGDERNRLSYIPVVSVRFCGNLSTDRSSSLFLHGDRHIRLDSVAFRVYGFERVTDVCEGREGEEDVCFVDCFEEFITKWEA